MFTLKFYESNCLNCPLIMFPSKSNEKEIMVQIIEKHINYRQFSSFILGSIHPDFSLYFDVTHSLTTASSQRLNCALWDSLENYSFIHQISRLNRLSPCEPGTNGSFFWEASFLLFQQK